MQHTCVQGAPVMTLQHAFPSGEELPWLAFVEQLAVVQALQHHAAF